MDDSYLQIQEDVDLDGSVSEPLYPNDARFWADSEGPVKVHHMHSHWNAKKKEEDKQQLVMMRTVSLVLGFTVLALALGWLGYEIWYWNEFQSRLARKMNFWEYLQRRMTGRLEGMGAAGESHQNRGSAEGQKKIGHGQDNGKVNGTAEPSSLDVSAATFQQLIERPDKLTVVLWHSHSCGGCQSYRPIFETVASAMAREPAIAGKIELVSINDGEFLRKDKDGANLAEQFDVNGIPAVLAYRDGQLVDKLTKLNVDPNQLVQFVIQNM